MKSLFLLSIFLIVCANSKAQNCIKFKIETIDSTSFSNYYYLRCSEKDGKKRTLFFKKKSDDNIFNCLKLGSTYLFKIGELSRDSLADGTPNPRGLFGITRNGVTILEANEIAYYVQGICIKE